MQVREGAPATGGPDLTRGVHAGTVQGKQGQSILVKKVQKLYFSLQCQVFVCVQIGVLYRGHSRIQRCQPRSPRRCEAVLKSMRSASIYIFIRLTLKFVSKTGLKRCEVASEDVRPAHRRFEASTSHFLCLDVNVSTTCCHKKLRMWHFFGQKFNLCALLLQRSIFYSKFQPTKKSAAFVLVFPSTHRAQRRLRVRLSLIPFPSSKKMVLTNTLPQPLQISGVWVFQIRDRCILPNNVPSGDPPFTKTNKRNFHRF